MVTKECPWCGGETYRIDAKNWHCPHCGTMIVQTGRGFDVNVPRWSHWAAMILRPIRFLRFIGKARQQ